MVGKPKVRILVKSTLPRFSLFTEQWVHIFIFTRFYFGSRLVGVNGGTVWLKRKVRNFLLNLHLRVWDMAFIDRLFAL